MFTKEKNWINKNGDEKTGKKVLVFFVSYYLERSVKEYGNKGKFIIQYN